MIQGDDSHLWDRFCKLGEMMGDGLHWEEDGKWISKEYNKLSRILLPDMHKDIRKAKADAINKQMAFLLAKSACSCGGKLIQKKKGTKVSYCEVCNNRYVAKAVRKRKTQ